MHVASPEDLIVAKLEWAKLGESRRQVEDVAHLLKSQSSLDTAYLNRWIDVLGVRGQWDEATRLAGGGG